MNIRLCSGKGAIDIKEYLGNRKNVYYKMCEIPNKADYSLYKINPIKFIDNYENNVKTLFWKSLGKRIHCDDFADIRDENKNYVCIKSDGSICIYNEEFYWTDDILLNNCIKNNILDGLPEVEYMSAKKGHFIICNY